jgi:signal transduction histidine kinase
MGFFNNQIKPTILVVDDEASILELVSIILGSRGYHVLKANDAQTALALVQEHAPALVLLDYMMPEMDGLTTLKHLRAEHPDSYVIMFTGKGNEEIAVELMKAGASDYMLKPFNNQNLIDRIENVIRIRNVEIRNRELIAEREMLIQEIKAWNLQLEERILIESEALHKAHAEVVQSQKLATLGYLAAGMAHEIRNPLNSIALFTQLIKDGLNDPETLEYVDKILKEVDRVDATLRNLLDTARRPQYELRDIQIDNLVQETLDRFKPQTTIHRIEIIYDLKTVPPPLRADPAEIEQIFTNLFLNAIHEMPDGGKLEVVLDHEEPFLTVLISDTGNGIPKENLPNIFDPFFTTKSKGTGMGLSVVLRIVKNYGGKIEVTKSDSSGTSFLIHLPVASPLLLHQ